MSLVEVQECRLHENHAGAFDDVIKAAGVVGHEFECLPGDSPIPTMARCNVARENGGQQGGVTDDQHGLSMCNLLVDHELDSSFVCDAFFLTFSP